MKIIPLTQGKVTTVDDCDYEYLSQRKWSYLGGRNNCAATYQCVIPDCQDCGPYASKADSEETRLGLERFYKFKDVPGYITTDQR
jgi:hypothetical protein